MTTSCMQAIKQQLEAMPLEEFENLLKGVTINKAHEAMPQHAELLSQLKHHVKVPPDEPIQSKASDKECRTFWKSLNQRDARHQSYQHRLSSSGGSSSSAASTSNMNGNVGSLFSVNQHPTQEYTTLGKSFLTGDQNANPVSCSSDTPSSSHRPVLNLNQGKYCDFNNLHHHHSTLAYGNSLDVDPGGSNGRCERDAARSSDRRVTNKTSDKNSSYGAQDEDEVGNGKPDKYTDVTLPLFAKPTSTAPLSASRTGFPNNNGGLENSGASTSWDLHGSQNSHVQLNDGYKSVASVTSGCSSYGDRATPARESTSVSPPSSMSAEHTYGTVRSSSPTLPIAAPSALVSRSPTLEGSQYEKPRLNRLVENRKKRSAKNVLRETLINPQDMPGYKGNQNIDELLEFVEGSQSKKKGGKDKKKESKPKSNEKQVLSKAASLDENSLGYGTKKSEEALTPRGRGNKEVEKKNSTNITKSSTAICSSGAAANEITVAKKTKTSSASPPMVNGVGPAASEGKEGKTHGKGVNNNNNTGKGGSSSVNSGKSSGLPKNHTQNQTAKEEPAATVTKIADAVLEAKSEPLITPPAPRQVVEAKSKGKAAVVAKTKVEEEKFTKPDEAEGPYVLVQSKKKREKKKTQQRESENFARAHAEQARRESGRARRINTERRKSVGSVPGSENSECSDDDDSVRSLPAGECTPRERIPKPCSSSGGTPQTSYADIARMSKDETGKTSTPPISLLPSVKTKVPAKSSVSVASPAATVTPPAVVVAVTSDSNFPALSPPSSSEKTVPAVVSTAVWPGRPQRFDPDGVLKEKPSTTLNDSKAEEEVLSKEGSLPVDYPTPSQPTSSQNISQKCSTSPKVAVGPKEKETSVPTLPVVEHTPLTLPKVEVSRSNSCLEFGQQSVVQAQSLSAKVPVIKKSKDKPVKVSTEESLNKANLNKGTDHNDTVAFIQTTEPVVFCGGKFDSSQLPVGQKSGFEFGFGVIEALNDNNNGVYIVPVTKGVPMAPVTASYVDEAQAETQSCRSQEQSEQKEKLTPDKDPAVTNSMDKRNNNNNKERDDLNKGDASGSLTGGVLNPPASGKVSPVVPPQEKKKKKKDTQSVVSRPIPNPEPVHSTEVPCAKSCEANDGGAELTNAKSTPSLPISLAPEKKPPKSGEIDIAQLFTPPVSSAEIHDSVLAAGDYMNEYAKRLTALSKEGKLTYHRVP